jgi:hypothetical protein
MSDRENLQENGKGSAFDQALTRALRPVQPPETLAKFLAIAAEAHEHKRRTGRRWFRPASGGLLFINPWPRAFAGGLLTAALMLGAFVAEQAHRRHQQAEATQEFATSMRITDEAIERTREQLLRAGVPLDQ